MTKSFMLLVAVSFLAVAFAGCTSTNDDTDGDTVVVEMVSGLKFDPVEVTIKANTTVLWINRDTMVHTVTDDDGLFDSGTMKATDKFEFEFTEPGEYKYYCKPHGSCADGECTGMWATVFVTNEDGTRPGTDGGA